MICVKNQNFIRAGLLNDLEIANYSFFINALNELFKTTTDEVEKKVVLSKSDIAKFK